MVVVRDVVLIVVGNIRLLDRVLAVVVDDLIDVLPVVLKAKGFFDSVDGIPVEVTVVFEDSMVLVGVDVDFDEERVDRLVRIAKNRKLGEGMPLSAKSRSLHLADVDCVEDILVSCDVDEAGEVLDIVVLGVDEAGEVRDIVVLGVEVCLVDEVGEVRGVLWVLHNKYL